MYLNIQVSRCVNFTRVQWYDITSVALNDRELYKTLLSVLQLLLNVIWPQLSASANHNVTQLLQISFHRQTCKAGATCADEKMHIAGISNLKVDLTSTCTVEKVEYFGFYDDDGDSQKSSE